MIALAARRLFPVQPQPGEIFQNGGFVFRFAAGEVDILDPQQEPSARGVRCAPRQKSGKGVAQMQMAGRGGGEACDEISHGKLCDIAPSRAACKAPRAPLAMKHDN